MRKCRGVQQGCVISIVQEPQLFKPVTNFQIHPLPTTQQHTRQASPPSSKPHKSDHRFCRKTSPTFEKLNRSSQSANRATQNTKLAISLHHHPYDTRSTKQTVPTAQREAHRHNVLLHDPERDPRPSSSSSSGQWRRLQPLEWKRLYFGYGSNLWHKQMAQRCPGAEFLGIARLRGYQWMINKRGYATIAKVDDPSDPGSDSGGGGGSSSSASGGPDEGDDGEDEDEVEVEIENVNHKNTVWGAVWSLTPDDEAALDKDEGVPFVYEKRELDGIEFWAGDVRRLLPYPGAVLAEIQGYTNKKYNSNKKKEKEKYKYKRLGKPEMVSMLVYIDFRHNRPGMSAKEEYHHRMRMAIWDALEVGIPSSYVKCVMREWIKPGGSKNGKVGLEHERTIRQQRAKSAELAEIASRQRRRRR